MTSEQRQNVENESKKGFVYYKRQETMLTSLKDLKTLRVKKEQFKEAYEHAMKEFNDINELLLTNMVTNRDRLNAAEEALRVLALDEFKETGNKKQVGGIGIRIMTKLEYDVKEAHTWAMDHKMALKLDVKTFENFVKAEPLCIPFVEIKEVPQATLPKEIKLEEE